MQIWEEISGVPAAVKEAPKRLLPLPHISNLQHLARLLTCVPPSQRAAFASECLAPKFLSALCDAFHTAEDQGSEDALSLLWRIVKGLFLLSNQKLTERCLKQDVYEDIMGILEYDDGLPAPKRIAHRQVLQLQVRFNAVVALEEDEEMLERIHLHYRLMYVRDIVLPRLLDDSSLASMTQVAHGNLSAILENLQKTPALLEQVFAQMRQKDLQSLVFMQDLCRLSKVIPPSQRQALFERLIERRLFAILTPFLSDGAAMCCRLQDNSCSKGGYFTFGSRFSIAREGVDTDACVEAAVGSAF
jgi:protein phosphatase-4 regulatory subunit 3